MSSNPISPELSEAPSFATRVFSCAVKKWLKRTMWTSLVLVVFLGLALVEIHTSLLQSWLFTRTNKRISYQLSPGRSWNIEFPRPAPFDDRRGYSKLPDFRARLDPQGYRITQQVQQSETLMNLINYGIAPPYREPAATGIDIRGTDGRLLFRYAQGELQFNKIDEIPPLVVKTLLFLENRELDRPSSSWQNPAIEWERLLKAGFLYLGSKLYLPVPVQGGSTLAVQLEKFRHSPSGRTDSPLEKLRQIVGASLKAYREGVNTRAWRERIIIDYLNTVPLAAAPGYGEIHGIGEGLHAWFGMQLSDAVQALKAPELTTEKVRAFKHVLTLLISVRAPTVFLVEERSSLDDKVAQFVRLMAREGVIDWEMATALLKTPIQFAPAAPAAPQPSSVKNKAANAIRTTMMESLGVTNVYDLNRMHLEVQSTIDVPLQKTITDFLNRLSNPAVVNALGLNGERLLEGKDPSKVVYSFLLVEPTPNGNLIRVQADNLPGPLDFNKSVKLELGSTAKLRTLTHYLELVAELHKELSPLDAAALKAKSQGARDPITLWAVETLRAQKGIGLNDFLDRAMDRKYSASPYEAFFTGGGLHHFENFDSKDNVTRPDLREAFRNSTNLVFIRLMRDLVSYHRARLQYNADTVLSDQQNPDRRRLLEEIAEEEARLVLRRAFQTYRGATPQQIMDRMVRSRPTAKHLAVLFFAWKVGTGEEELAAWLAQHQGSTSATNVGGLFRIYSNPKFSLADYGYLLSLHPLDVWCAGELVKNPRITWDQLYARGAEARRMSSAWLLNPRNRRAQDLRLRIRLEKEAFASMTPYWQRLGFPFKTMVPSYATAIGNSSDRPVALADLLGILINDGVRRRTTSLTKIHFAHGTPYETVFERTLEKGEQLLVPEVAQAVRKAMADVVEHGTARRLSGVFKLSDGKPITVGGKTGSGDNRFETFNRHGGVISSRATNRTATFVFYIGDRYFGVVTAYVQGREAGDYRFTSALPVTVLKILAPTIITKLDLMDGWASASIEQPPAVQSSKFKVQGLS